ncbi:NrfD/PsrC family molybdoenzyme membrane anchor subunit [Rhodoblastus sp.]|uniref:NrfD/PsrC family molybdoenzyme membrane anchor subunit n=1 Tax=Rhodoblastus sp. TaxID=1962975 RepID=UPI003F9D982C
MANPRITPDMAIWGWQIATYLFLGGFAAGLMVFSGWAILSGRDEQTPFAVNRAPMVALAGLAVGMTALFFDLERKINVWRFYATLRVTSPMSWGSWVLILVFPALALLALAGLPKGFPPLARWLEGLPFVGPRIIAPVFRLCFDWRRPLAALNVALGIALGIYTGILLSGFNARPFWHSALLGPLFLISGLSTGAAMIVLAASDPRERHLFGRIDLGLILIEFTLVGLFLIDMLNGDALHQAAVAHVLDGNMSALFWIGFMGLGLGVPAVLEAAMWRRSMAPIAIAAAALVLGGGFLLREIVVTTGQQTSWTQFHNQFDPALLQRLRSDGMDADGRF